MPTTASRRQSFTVRAIGWLASWPRRFSGLLASIWKTPAKRRQLLLVLPFLAIAWYGSDAAVHRLAQTTRIGFDPQNETCLPWRIYGIRLLPEGSEARNAWLARLEAKDSSLRGSFLRVLAQHTGSPGFDGRLLGKMLLGLPGDEIEVRNDRLYVNGRYWDRLWLLQRLAKPEGAFDRRFVVPPGHVFMAGAARNSFDSRYWGTVPASRVLGVVQPWF